MYEKFQKEKDESSDEVEEEKEEDYETLIAKLRAPPSGQEEVDAKAKKKAELLLKMNAALKENNQAVIEE
jgi:hypothetical protein